MNSKRMLALCAGTLLAAMLSTASAQNLFKDNFNRANAANLGADYTYYAGFAASPSVFGIVNNAAVTTAVATDGIALVSSNKFLMQSAEEFAISVSLQTSTATTSRAGLVFNFQDAKNFNLVRFRSQDGTVQILTYSNGSLTSYRQEVNASYITSTPISMQLTGNGSGAYTLTLSATERENFVINWTSTTFSGGQAGLYYNGVATGANAWTFENLSAINPNIPEAKTTALLTAIGVLLCIALARRRRRG